MRNSQLPMIIKRQDIFVIFYFVHFEANYDDFHNESNLIYRIISVEKGTTGTDYYASTPLPLPETVRTDLKDADMTTGLSRGSSPL